MRKWCFLLGAVLLAVVLVSTLHGPTQTHAVSGCCKERSSYKENWRPSGKSFDECEQANNRERDNIFSPQGLVWWDVNC